MTSRFHHRLPEWVVHIELSLLRSLEVRAHLRRLQKSVPCSTFLLLCCHFSSFLRVSACRRAKCPPFLPPLTAALQPQHPSVMPGLLTSSCMIISSLVGCVEPPVARGFPPWWSRPSIHLRALVFHFLLFPLLLAFLVAVDLP